MGKHPAVQLTENMRGSASQVPQSMIDEFNASYPHIADEGVECWDEEEEEYYKVYRVKDLTDEAYEEEVGLLAYYTANEDLNMAIALLADSRTQGGWMMGDPTEWLKRNKGRT